MLMKIEKQKRSTFHFCHLYLDLEIGPGVSREKHPGLKLYPDLEKAKRDRGLTYQITHIYLLHCIAIKGPPDWSWNNNAIDFGISTKFDLRKTWENVVICLRLFSVAVTVALTKRLAAASYW